MILFNYSTLASIRRKLFKENYSHQVCCINTLLLFMLSKFLLIALNLSFLRAKVMHHCFPSTKENACPVSAH